MNRTINSLVAAGDSERAARDGQKEILKTIGMVNDVKRQADEAFERQQAQLNPNRVVPISTLVTVMLWVSLFAFLLMLFLRSEAMAVLYVPSLWLSSWVLVHLQAIMVVARQWPDKPMIRDNGALVLFSISILLALLQVIVGITITIQTVGDGEDVPGHNPDGGQIFSDYMTMFTAYIATGYTVLTLHYTYGMRPDDSAIAMLWIDDQPET